MVIKVKNLSYTYSNADKEAVSALKFTEERGEIFGFLGPVVRVNHHSEGFNWTAFRLYRWAN